MTLKMSKASMGVAAVVVLVAVVAVVVVSTRPNADPELIASIESELRAELGESAWCTTALGESVGVGWKGDRAMIADSKCAYGLEDLGFGTERSYAVPGHGRFHEFTIGEDSPARFQNFLSKASVLRVPCGKATPIEVRDVKRLEALEGVYRVETHLEDVNVNVRLALANTGCDFVYPEPEDGVTLVRRRKGKPIQVLAFNATAEHVDELAAEEAARVLETILEESLEQQRQAIKARD